MALFSCNTWREYGDESLWQSFEQIECMRSVIAMSVIGVEIRACGAMRRALLVCDARPDPVSAAADGAAVEKSCVEPVWSY